MATVLHIRRAGDISGQQLGSFMLEAIRAHGGSVVRGRVRAIERIDCFALSVSGEEGVHSIAADIVVNAAGPSVGAVARLLGEELPVFTVFQQKIAFEDTQGAIRRSMPFSIDLDGQSIDWTAQERALLAEDPVTAWLAQPMPGSIHCRPEGGDRANG